MIANRHLCNTTEKLIRKKYVLCLTFYVFYKNLSVPQVKHRILLIYSDMKQNPNCKVILLTLGLL